MILSVHHLTVVDPSRQLSIIKFCNVQSHSLVSKSNREGLNIILFPKLYGTHSVGAIFLKY